MKKFGFTLAEVLITLSIVGVISALTVPNLVGNASKRGQVALLRKAHLELSEAIETEMAERDVKKVKNIFNTDGKIQSFLMNHFKITKNCKTDTSSCLASTIYNIDGSEMTVPSNLNCITNASGITICMSNTANDNVILIDVNGKKDPNIKGRDVFGMVYSTYGEIVDEGIIYSQSWLDDKVAEVEADEGLTDEEKEELIAKYKAMNDDENESDATARCTSSTHPYGCLNLIINDDWVMNY